MGKIRVLSFTAFCFIDIQQYNEAFKTLQQAQAVNSSLYSDKALLLDQEQGQHSYNLEQDLLYCKRTEWILLYHIALCLYMVRSYEEAETVRLSSVHIVFFLYPEIFFRRLFCTALNPPC
jgi:hypothetical protein